MRAEAERMNLPVGKAPFEDTRAGDRPVADRHPLARKEDRPPIRAIDPIHPRRWIILEADDFGLLHAFNEGIREAFQNGALTSTCLRANGYAFDHAIREVLPACNGLSLGVHLCLNEAAPVAPSRNIAPLVGTENQLRPGFAWLMRVAKTNAGIAAIEYELRAQIERVLHAGVTIDHLNSHQHVHMIPPIFELVCKLAAEYGVAAVRLSRELPHSPLGFRRRLQPLINRNVIKHHLLNHYARHNERFARQHGLPVTDYFLGVRYTGVMSVSTIRAGLDEVPYGSVELLLHPARGPDPRDAACPVRDLHRYVATPRREGELRALCSDRLAEFLKREGWTPTTFGRWSQLQRANMPHETTPTISTDVQRLCGNVRPVGPLWVSAAHDDSRAFAQLALDQSAENQHVLDIGTGTGVIAICLAQAGRRVTACDISAAAVRTALANARSAGVTFACVQSDLLADVPGTFDLVVFNPPYGFGPDNFFTAVAKNLLRRVPLVRHRSGLAMPRKVLKFHQELIERLILQVPAALNPGGRVLIHAYESEVPALQAVLPEGAAVSLLRHPAFSNQTVGMLIRLPA